MSNLQQYSILLAVAGGTLLAEEQEIDFSRTANAVRVATVAKGFSGTSPGAPEVMVNVRGAMPSAGLEFDAGPYILSQTPIPFQLLGPGGKVMKGDMIIERDNGKHGVGTQASYDFSGVMAFSPGTQFS